MRAIVIFAAMAVSANARAQAPELDSPASCAWWRTLDRRACRVNATSDALREQVRLSLRDPYTAVFTGERLYSSNDPPALALCGQVNAKNSFGAYVGASYFLSTSSGVVRLAAADEATFKTLWSMFCRTPI